MIDQPSPEITGDTPEDERVYVKTQSQRQPGYTAPEYNEPKPIDGVILRDKDTLVYSYVTEYQIDTYELDNLSL